MERFIESRNYVYQFLCEYLKSSMERFIEDNETKNEVLKAIFKIQYGEIYSGDETAVSINQRRI